MTENSTLAEVFLGLGGRAAQVVGTTFTAAGLLYGINKSSGHGIYILERLPYWMGLKQEIKYTVEPIQQTYDQEQHNHYHQEQRQENLPVVATGMNFLTEALFYVKISLLIGGGVLIKAAGAWALRDSTSKIFNSLLYKK